MNWKKSLMNAVMLAGLGYGAHAQELREVNHFSVNTDSTFQEYRVGRQKKLEKDFATLSLNANKEEVWAYVKDTKTMYEIGINEGPVNANIRTDFLDSLKKEHEKLTLYHIHPEKTGTNKDKVTPSTDDARTTRNLHLSMERHHKDPSLNHVIYTPAGRVEFEYINLDPDIDKLKLAVNAIWAQPEENTVENNPVEVKKHFKDMGVKYNFTPFKSD